MKRHVKVGASTCIDMIDAFSAKLQQLDPSSVEGAVAINSAEDQDYISGADVNDQYIQDLMSEVADETTALETNPGVCTWEVEEDNITFIVAGFDGDFVHEYTCPITDLTGDIDTDLNYILDYLTA